ncbi:MAG: OmpH family outer membrane protein [Pirellulales bacterium]
MKKIIALVAAVSCFSVTGCNQNANLGNGPVAIVDIDVVASKLGRDKQILQMIEQREVSLNEQVVATQNSLIRQLNKKKSEFGDVSEEEAKELAQLQIKANTILASTRTQAQTNLTSFQLEVVNRFRAEVKPIAMELATKRGCRVVLSKNDSVVFAFDQTVDLTDEVVVQLQSKLASSTTATTVTSNSDQSVVKQASAENKSSVKK